MEYGVGDRFLRSKGNRFWFYLNLFGLVWFDFLNRIIFKIIVVEKINIVFNRDFESKCVLLFL